MLPHNLDEAPEIDIPINRDNHTPSLDEIVKGTPAAVQQPQNYGITEEVLRSFHAKVTFKDDGTYFVSHHGGFEGIKRLYSEIKRVEFDLQGKPKQGGIPHEILAALTPSEILALYMARSDYKATHKQAETQRYGNLKETYIKSIIGLIEGATGKSYYIRQTKKKERDAPPLDERLSKIGLDKMENLFYILELKSRKSHDPLGKSVHSEKDYERVISAYTNWIVSFFEQMYKAKNVKR